MIHEKVKIIGCGILIDSTLIFSDLHLGIEESYRQTLLPKQHYKQVKNIILSAITKYKPSTVVLNGDIKHEFGTINDGEWKNSLDLIDTIRDRCELVIIKGNHDKILESIAKKKNVELFDKHLIGDIAIVHGDEIIDLPKSIKTIIIGHEHPAITLEEGNKKEKYKCYISGKYHSCKLIVMPSTNQLTEGTNILEEELLSPYLTDISEYDVFVITNSLSNAEVLQFGKVKDL